MEISGDYTFDAPQEMVWQALLNPEVLSSVLPGNESLDLIGEDEYAGNLNVKIGPVQGKFRGKIKLNDINEPDSFTMVVDGKGAPGFVKATGAVALNAQENQTHKTYEGSAQVGGRIASVGQRLLDSSARSIIRQSLEGINEYLKLQQAAQEVALAGGATTEEEIAEAVAQVEIPTYQPPSQTNMALNVAKDVADDFIPAQYRPTIVAVFVFIFLMLVCRICKK